MNFVTCGHCYYFKPIDFETKSIYKGSNIGVCKLHNIIILTQHTVCEDFLIRSGLFTTCSIPEYCKNKQKNSKHFKF